MLPALTLPFFASLFYFSGLFDPTISRIGYGFSKVFTMIWPVICLVWIIGWRQSAGTGWQVSAPPSWFPGGGRWDGAWRWFLEWRNGPSQLRVPAQPLTSIFWGTVSGMAIVALMLLLLQTPMGDIVKADAPRVLEKVKHLGFLEFYLLAAILISVAHSALEEYFWRWFAYGSLRRMLSGPWPHVVAAIGFSLHHYVLLWNYFTPGMALLLGTAVGLGGVIWSVLYQRTGTLVGSWVSHVIVDFGIFWVGWQLISPSLVP